MIAITLFLSLFVLASASDLALYWGQASAGSQKSLAEYCSSTPGTIYIVSFLSAFSGSGTPTLNVAGACSDTFSGSSLLHCSQIAQDIKTCQSQGKKILLSLGGASGAYGFSSDADGAAFAQTLWDMFGGGSGAQRPFDDAVVDGFDFDIENNNQVGYVALANKLRELFATSSKQFYLSAAPQCPYPDASVGDLLAQAQIDYAFIQFYNNYCSTTGSQFNWDTWQNFATNTSPNKSIKLFLGLPGSTSAAGSGYASPDQVKQTLDKISSSSNFGGISIWDASQADLNVVNGQSFVAQMGAMLGNGNTSPAPVESPVQSAEPATSAAVSLAVTAENNAVTNAAAVTTPASVEPTTTVLYTVTVTQTSGRLNTLTGLPTPSAYKYTPGQQGQKAWSNTTAAQTTDSLKDTNARLNAFKWSNDTLHTTIVRSHTVTVTVTVSPGASGTAAALKLKGAANLDFNEKNPASQPTVTTVPDNAVTTPIDAEPTTYYTTTVMDTVTVTQARQSTVQTLVQTVSPTAAAGSPRLITSYRVFVTTIGGDPAPTAAAAAAAAATPLFGGNTTQPLKREVYEDRYHYQHRHHARYVGIHV